MSQTYRKRALRQLTTKVGVYALCDLDKTPIYVGQSVDGIRARVNRHLTSARSDIIANRQIDVWEIAFVMAWPTRSKAQVRLLEALLFNAFDAKKPLMNGSRPVFRGRMPKKVPAPTQCIQVMSDEDIRVRREPALRLPRQIDHIGRLVDHILNVKDSPQLRQSLAAHFSRLAVYRRAFLKQSKTVTREAGTPDESDQD